MALFARTWERRLAAEKREQEDASAAAWLEQLPGVVAGALFRERLEACFCSSMQGELHTYSGEHGLKVHLLRPLVERAADAAGCTQRASEAAGCVVFIHGGGWLGGAPSQFYPYAASLRRSQGVATACCEVRSLLTHPRTRPAVDAVEDVRRCVRFLQEHSEELGFERSRVALVGASSGGQLAAMAALREPGLRLAGLVLFNPVLDLHFSEGWWQRRPFVWLGAWLLWLRCGTAALRSSSPLEHVVAPLGCPALILHGTADHLVPMAEIEAFAEGVRSGGDECGVVPFTGEGHFFFNKRVSPTNFTRCLGLIGSFLASAGVVPARDHDRGVG